jgi:hypothetical protein
MNPTTRTPGEVKIVLWELGSLVLTLLAAVVFVAADWMIRTERLAILPGVVLTIGGLYTAFWEVGFPILPHRPVSPLAAAWPAVYVLIAAIPMIVAGFRIGLDQSFLPMLLILPATLTGFHLGIRRRLSRPPGPASPGAWRVLDSLRQAIVTCGVGLAAMWLILAFSLV